MSGGACSRAELSLVGNLLLNPRYPKVVDWGLYRARERGTQEIIDLICVPALTKLHFVYAFWGLGATLFFEADMRGAPPLTRTNGQDQYCTSSNLLTARLD